MQSPEEKKIDQVPSEQKKQAPKRYETFFREFSDDSYFQSALEPVGEKLEEVNCCYVSELCNRDSKGIKIEVSLKPVSNVLSLEKWYQELLSKVSYSFDAVNEQYNNGKLSIEFFTKDPRAIKAIKKFVEGEQNPIVSPSLLNQ